MSVMLVLPCSASSRLIVLLNGTSRHACPAGKRQAANPNILPHRPGNLSAPQAARSTQVRLQPCVAMGNDIDIVHASRDDVTERTGHDAATALDQRHLEVRAEAPLVA
jgi:hypothetical protein